MSNFPKISAEKSLLVGPTDPAHKIPGPSPDLPGIAAINGPLIIGGISDGYVSERYTRSMISVLPASGEVKDNPLSASGELFGPLADAITISKQGNPAAGSGNRYDGVGIRVNANAHKIEGGEFIQILCEDNINVKSPTTDWEGDITHNGNLIDSNLKNCTGQGCDFTSSTINVQSWKGFDIKHPTKENHRLRYVCLEGPEGGVYIRGRVTDDVEIELPDYWKDLVDIQSITVSLTAIGVHQDVIVKKWDDKKIYLQSKEGIPIDCFYHIFAERKDGEKLIVEYSGESPADYPGNSSQYSIAGYDYGRSPNT
jgi:hypothetical protein